jgi:hypothetical protein
MLARLLRRSHTLPLLVAGAFIAMQLVGSDSAFAQSIIQPSQPASGPGGADYSHADVRVTAGGFGANAYYVFEPVSPKPASAPLVVITHGYFETFGYDSMKDLITHTVRKGNVVVYPRYQDTILTPCLGYLLNPEGCVSSALKGIRDGIAFLQASPDRVQPELDKASYFGFSFGGIITANLTNRWVSLNLPQPRVIFLDDPHDGDGSNRETMLDTSLAGIPATALVQCHSGSQSVSATGGCNAFFPRLDHIPTTNKNLVETFADNHGTPALSSAHGVSKSQPTDAYDWYFVWKSFDAMRLCKFSGAYCDYGMGDTPEHRFNGLWSDGVPVTPLTIKTSGMLIP